MSYLCRHVLLKDAAGETQGFARFESAPDGCSVDARASGVPSGTRLLLLRRGGGFREAGAMREGAFRSLLRGEDAAGLCGAAIAQAGKALVYGGEGDVSAQARKAAAQAFAPKAVSASRAERCRAVAAEPYKSADEAAAVASPPAADAVPPEAFAIAKEPDDSADAREGEAASITSSPAADAVPPEAFAIAKEPDDGAGAREGEDADGWTFRSAGDGLRFDAMYQQDGSVVLSAHAIAADTPLPPPGLPDAERVAGFWIEKNKKI